MSHIDPMASTTSRVTYDLVAEEYDHLVQHGDLIHAIVLPPLLELAGDVAGLDACDLACGTGVVARVLVVRGTRVVGIDVSAKMLAIAQRYEQRGPLGIRYALADAHALRGLESDSLDVVVCDLAKTDIPEPLDALAKAVNRMLRPGGIFLWSLPQPRFQAPGSCWFQNHAAPVVGVSWFPDGESLAFGSHDGTVQLWKASRGLRIRVLSQSQSPVVGVAWAPPAGLYLASVSLQAVHAWG